MWTDPNKYNIFKNRYGYGWIVSYGRRSSSVGCNFPNFELAWDYVFRASCKVCGAKLSNFNVPE